MAVQHTLGVASATIVTRGSARATGPSDRQRAHLNTASLTCALQHKGRGARLKASAEKARGARGGGDHAEVAETHSRAIGMGFTWAAALFAVVVVPRWVFGVNTDVPIPLVFGVFGFIAGVTFSGLLVLTEGRRRFDQMSLPRFAGWGAAGGLLLSALFAKAASLDWGDVLTIVPTFAIACAVCASGSLAVARRAVRRELPDIHEVS
jgi:hypothetical protein